jgi:hypothetical protein
MRSLFMIAMFVVLGRLPMMFGGFFVMLSGGGVVLSGVLGVRHWRHSQMVSSVPVPGKHEAQTRRADEQFFALPLRQQDVTACGFREAKADY